MLSFAERLDSEIKHITSELGDQAARGLALFHFISSLFLFLSFSLSLFLSFSLSLSLSLSLLPLLAPGPTAAGIITKEGKRQMEQQAGKLQRLLPVILQHLRVTGTAHPRVLTPHVNRLHVFLTRLAAPARAPRAPPARCERWR
jgi:hypothetical protein